MTRGAAAVVQGVKTGEMKILPQPVTRTFFSDRIDGLDRDTSAAIVKALTDAGQLDAAGFLQADPRCSTTIPIIRLLCMCVAVGLLGADVSHRMLSTASCWSVVQHAIRR